MFVALDIINYALAAIMIGVTCTWIWLVKSMFESYSKTPQLDKFNNKITDNPKVSIILPARNEEKFIDKCLKSLINQDYDNYEIIAIDDSSDDSTGEIIERFAKKLL